MTSCPYQFYTYAIYSNFKISIEIEFVFYNFINKWNKKSECKSVQLQLWKISVIHVVFDMQNKKIKLTRHHLIAFFITIVIASILRISLVDAATTQCDDDSNLKIFLHGKKKATGENGGLKLISFCCNCRNPEKEGSHIRAYVAAKGPQDFKVSSGIVYAVPNDGNTLKLMNSREMKGMVSVFTRGGGVTIVDKVRTAQDSGAVGVIIIDNGTCSRNVQQCGIHPDEGFGIHEDWMAWEQIKIPCLLITKAGGNRLNNILNPDVVHIPGIGSQFVIQNKRQSEVGDEL